MGLNKSEIYNTVSNELEKRANKRNVAIKGIKGELFDVLTFGQDAINNKEACTAIIKSLNDKIKAAENAEHKNDNYINNLKFIRDDTENRMKLGEGLKFDTKKEEGKKYIDLNKGGFNEKVLDTVANSIAKLAKSSDTIDDILIKKLIENEKYKEELKKKLEDKYKSSTESGLNETQKKNLKAIIDGFDSNKQEGTGTEGTGTEGAGTEGAGTEGTGTEGAGTEGAGTEGTGTEGAGTEGTGTEGTGTEGAGTEGTGTEGAGTEGAGTEGTGTEGAGTEGTGTEGTGTEGTGTEGGPTAEQLKKRPGRRANPGRSTEVSKETRTRLRQLERENKNLTKKNADLLEQIKKAPSSTEVAKLKKQIDDLKKDKQALMDRYEGTLPKFEDEDGKTVIDKLETQPVTLTWISKKKEGGQTKLRIGPEIAIRHNILSRHRINATIKKLNDLGKELGPDKNHPDAKGVKKGVNYILNKSFLLHGGPISSAYKATRNIFKIRTIPEFDEAFGKQKKLILEDLKTKMLKNTTSTEDDKIIKAVSNRLDYYQAAYKKTFIRV